MRVLCCNARAINNFKKAVRAAFGDAGASEEEKKESAPPTEADERMSFVSPPDLIMLGGDGLRALLGVLVKAIEAHMRTVQVFTDIILFLSFLAKNAVEVMEFLRSEPLFVKTLQKFIEFH